MTGFSEAVKEIEGELRQFMDEGDARDKDQWLRTLYDNYHRRFLADNSQIWGNGKIMIPFSLTAFAVYVSLETPTLVEILLLGLASSALIAIWLVNAENHRAFQNKSMAWLVAIERVLGLKEQVPPKLPDNRLNRLLSRPAAIQTVIRLLACGIPLAWIAVALYQVLR